MNWTYEEKNEVCEKLNLMPIGYSNMAKELLEWARRETAM